MQESRGTYARERARLTEAHRRRAAVLIAGDRVEGRGLDLVDTACAGLVLRVTRRSGTWLLKHRAGTVRLGDVDALPVASARIAADRARVAVTDGKAGRLATDLQTFEHAHRRGADLDVAVDAAFPVVVRELTEEERKRDGPWEWQDLIALFLAHKLPSLRERWSAQFEKHLRRAETGLTRRLASDVTLADLVKVRDRVARDRTASAAADTVEAVRAALDWAWRHHAPRAGLDGVEFPWWRERLTTAWSSTPRDHTPTLDELGRTLALAEKHKALGGTAKEAAPGMLAALFGVVLTGQRAGALTGTLRATVRPWAERPGWQVWTWAGTEMKGKVPHALPVPPAVLEVLARFRVDTTSPFLFPSRVPGKSVTAVGLTQHLDRLRGKAKPGRDGAVTQRPEADLLAAHAIRPWTPHDVRRTLAAFLDTEGLGGAASAVLAHRPPRAQGEQAERELAQSVTLKHYIHSQRLPLKAAGMEAWVAAVLAAYEAKKARLP